MLTLQYTLLILATTVADPPSLAMVLEVQGSPQVRRADKSVVKLEEMDIVFLDDKVSCPAGASVVFEFFDGRRQRVKEKTETRVAGDGCTPAEAVEELKSPAPKSAIVKGLSPIRKGGKPAAIIARDPPPPPIKPIYDSGLWTTRPSFTWQATHQAAGYRFELRNEDGATLWEAKSDRAKLDYPANHKPLAAGEGYHWRVYDLAGKQEKIVEGVFRILPTGLSKELVALQQAAKNGQRADRALAAAALEANRAYDEATQLYEELHKQLPANAAFRKALARMYGRAGRVSEAKKVLGAEEGGR